MLSGAVVVAALAACGSEPAGLPSPSAAPSISDLTVDTAAPRPTERPGPALHVLLTNDDGVGAAGIDAMARALRRLPDVRVSVVAPAANRSGTGSATSRGRVAYAPGETTSGVAATAVDGYPADTIAVALDQLGLTPDLVVSGVNRGANAGSAVPISGTVGAARAAIARGVPAVAASAAVPASGGSPKYAPAVGAVARWIADHRDELLTGEVTTETLVNVNTPYCGSEPVRGQRDVTVAKGDVRPSRVSDCRSSLRSPSTDVEALDNGYIAVTKVRAELATPYPR